MERRETYLTETPDSITLVQFPFRFASSQRPWILQALVKLMWSMLIATPLMMPVLFLGGWLLNDGHSGIPWLAAFVIWLAVIAALWSYRTHACFDARRGIFSECTAIWGRRFWQHEWGVSIFEAIGYGRNLGHRFGATPVVRLYAKADGFLVDGFLPVADLAEARRLAERLCNLSGLRFDGERTTGPQHNLNDLRHNGWMAERLQRG